LRHTFEVIGKSLQALSFQALAPHAVFPFNKRKEVIQCLIVTAVASPWSPAKSLI